MANPPTMSMDWYRHSQKGRIKKDLHLCEHILPKRVNCEESFVVSCFRIKNKVHRLRHEPEEPGFFLQEIQRGLEFRQDLLETVAKPQRGIPKMVMRRLP